MKVTSGRQQKHAFVGARRDDRFFQHEFEEIGEALQQAERADDIGPTTNLHRGPDLAVDKQYVSQHQQQTDHQDQNGDDLAEQPRPSIGQTEVLESLEEDHRLLRRQFCAADIDAAALGHGFARPRDWSAAAVS